MLVQWNCEIYFSGRTTESFENPCATEYEQYTHTSM